MRICTFPLYYIDSNGVDTSVFVDESDYSKYISGEKTLEEAFGHYIDKNTLTEIMHYEDVVKNKNYINS